MPLRLPIPLLLLGAGLLPACAGTGPDGRAAEAAGRLHERLANMQASLAAAGGRVADAGSAEPPGPRPPRAAPTPVVAPRTMPALPPPRDDSGPVLAPLRGTAAAPPQAAAQLLGLTPERLRLSLGEPALRRPEGPGAEVWLYTAEACALDLVLYRDHGGALRVAHAAARAAGEEGAAATGTEAECLRRIAGGAGGPARRPAA